MNANALVYCENEFGQIDGKVANGLARDSKIYNILGIIDSSKAGLDAGEYLDWVENGIPVFQSMVDALGKLGFVPELFIYGIAPLASFLDESQRNVLFAAMLEGMDIVSGLPEFLSEDAEFIDMAVECGVRIHDIRKPPPRSKLHNFNGRILNLETPVITVLGTDCAVGKRTTTVRLVEALKKEGINAVFIATGQTGLLQGASSDHIIMNTHQREYVAGDEVDFDLNYGALMSAMASPYVEKMVM